MSKKYFQLSKKTQQELLAEFCEALSNINTIGEAVRFLTDLLTKSEAIMLAKRIKIAKLLIHGHNYRSIQKALRVSHGTIAKVAAWLSEFGDGFRLVEKRTNKPKPVKKEIGEWQSLKRRYPSMFWPQLVIEEIVRSANRKQKEKISRVLKRLDRKSTAYKQLNVLLKD